MDVPPREFYRRMARSAALPKTSQPSPAAFQEVFDRLAAAGPVLCVTISSRLSGTFQSALVAAEASGAEVTVFDTLTASLGHGLQVLRACELAEAGRDVGEVVADLGRYRSEMTTLVLLNTLDNIVRGGRLTRFQGGLSKALDIRVLARDRDGEVVVLEKVHGRKKMLTRAMAVAHGEHPDLSDRDVGITHLDNASDVEVLREGLTRLCHPRGFIVNEMGPTMATYAGPEGIILSM